MSEIPTRLRKRVIERSGQRCEYCQLSQLGQEAVFHIDHIQPRAAGGPTTFDNLALACVSCSLRKGARQSIAAAGCEMAIALFNPRQHIWEEHFR